MSGHTPGPWKVFWAKDAFGNERSNIFIGIGEATGKGIADCGFGVWRGGDEEAAANARLIAAAPQLLEALKECLPLFEYVACGEVAEKARAAIALASNPEKEGE